MFEYAIYKGDDLLIIGTREECAKELDVKPETISFYCTPSYKKRVADRGGNRALIGERFEIDDFTDF